MLAIKQQMEALSTVITPARPTHADGIGGASAGPASDETDDQSVVMSTGGNASVSAMPTAVTDNQQQAGSYSDTTQPRTSSASMATSSPLVTIMHLWISLLMVKQIISSVSAYHIGQRRRQPPSSSSSVNRRCAIGQLMTTVTSSQ